MSKQAEIEEDGMKISGQLKKIHPRFKSVAQQDHINETVGRHLYTAWLTMSTPN